MKIMVFSVSHLSRLYFTAVSFLMSYLVKSKLQYRAGSGVFFTVNNYILHKVIRNFSFGFYILMMF